MFGVQTTFFFFNIFYLFNPWKGNCLRNIAELCERFSPDTKYLNNSQRSREKAIGMWQSRCEKSFGRLVSSLVSVGNTFALEVLESLRPWGHTGLTPRAKVGVGCCTWLSLGGSRKRSGHPRHRKRIPESRDLQEIRCEKSCKDLGYVFRDWSPWLRGNCLFLLACFD